MRSSNPVLSRIDDVAAAERATVTPSRGAGAYGTAAPSGTTGLPGAGPATRPMTLDDVVTRSVFLLMLTGLAAAASWLLVPANGATFAVMVGASFAGFALVLVISLMRITNPWLIGAYAVLQGVLLGVASRVFEQFYPGIVIQAVVGTFGVFAGMAVLYRFRVLRATPRFTRFVIGALIGVVGLSLVNFLVYLFTGHQALVSYSPTGQVGWLPIVFVLVSIGVGALTFILDFAAVEHGLRHGLPERYAWYCAFGILVGLIYLYWQILRLLSYLRR